MARIFRVGTRGSKLALAQTEWVVSRLKEIHPGVELEIVVIKTKGDKITDVPLARVGGKGLFVKEIEEALLREEIDLAVHSLKDVPTELPPGLELAAIPERESPLDALVSPGGEGLDGLPAGARVGTSSLRRAAQIRAVRPDLRVENLRGNLDTRLRKLSEGLYEAIVVAEAGLRRLGLSPPRRTMPPETMLPAIGQGALAVEARRRDEEVKALLAPLHHEETARCVAAERAFLGALGGGCQVPLAALARLRGETLVLEALIADPEGKSVLRARREGSTPEALGLSLAEELLARGGREILARVQQEGASL